jgi:hypothetical protein
MRHSAETRSGLTSGRLLGHLGLVVVARLELRRVLVLHLPVPEPGPGGLGRDRQDGRQGHHGRHAHGEAAHVATIAVAVVVASAAGRTGRRCERRQVDAAVDALFKRRTHSRRRLYWSRTHSHCTSWSSAGTTDSRHGCFELSPSASRRRRSRTPRALVPITRGESDKRGYQTEMSWEIMNTAAKLLPNFIEHYKIISLLTIFFRNVEYVCVLKH